MDRYARGVSTLSAERGEPICLEWLADGKHPLDWNGPAGRIFSNFREEDLDRPIIDQFEGVAGRHGDRIARAPGPRQASGAGAQHDSIPRASRLRHEKASGCCIRLSRSLTACPKLAWLPNL